jgi:DnaK suppressor protein
MSTRSVANRPSRSELKHFELLLRNRRQALLKDVEALEKDEKEASKEISGASIHSADRGTDRSENDVNLGCHESASLEIQEIDEALERILDGSFGLCQTCDEKIAKVRLAAIPYTRLCLACKKADEAT